MSSQCIIWNIEVTSWKARAYGIFTRVDEVSEIERVSAANEWDFWYFTNECENPVQNAFHAVIFFILYILRFSHQILLCEKVFWIFLWPITEAKRFFHMWEFCFACLIGQVKSKTLFHTANLIWKPHYVWNKAISLSLVHFIQIVLPILLYEYKDQALIKLNALCFFLLPVSFSTIAGHFRQY